MYWQFRYDSIRGINLLLNDLAPSTETECLIGRIEALREYPLPLVSPSLQTGEGTITFPVSLRPDEYIEMDWDGIVVDTSSPTERCWRM